MLKKRDAGGITPGSLEGARSASGGEPGAAVEVQRWSARRKKEVVLRLLRGEPVDAVSRAVSVPIYKLEQWRDRALAGIDAGRGLTLRMDHGTQYTADDFLNQIRFWGIAPSLAFVAEPETNGVAERFNRTLKEQAIHGRIFQNVEAVRAAVTDFKDRYNRHWRLEKLGFMSPHEARQAYVLRKAA